MHPWRATNFILLEQVQLKGMPVLFHSVKGIRFFVRLAYPLEVPFWIRYDFTCFKNLTRTEDFKRTENWTVHYTTE